MNPKALHKAQLRLRVASKTAADLKDCKTYGDFSDAWYIVLHAAKGIYTMLEQGSKPTPQGRQWFGGKNQERKDDPLLRYVTEARNDDEHGIEPITEYAPATLALGVKTPTSSGKMIDEYGNVFMNCGTAYRVTGASGPVKVPQLRSLDGKPIENRFTPPTARLINVRDRAGRVYTPPRSHLGVSIEPTPPIVADLMVKYLTGLLAEAWGFCKP